ncbi:MAG: hypothetical protein V4558_02765 [Gemmatimonadota bacterium]
MRNSRALAVFALALAGACSNAGEKLLLPSLPNGAVGVFVYLDRDGSQSYTTADTVFAGARVALLAAGGTDTIRIATSSVQGLATFDTVPLGSYRVAVDRKALGDSIATVVGDSGVIRLVGQPDSVLGSRAVRLAFAEVTIAQARALPVGRRVFIRGRVLSAMQFFRDSSSFIKDATGTIRITGSRHRPGRSGNNLGDSVSVFGTTGTRQGQPVLIDGLFASLGEGPAPVSVPVTVAEANNAKGGTLDAALVSVTSAKINDTLPSLPDFLVRIAEAANPAVRADVILDALINAPSNIFVPGLTISVKGVLVPRGDGTWVLKPRGGGDITLSN